MTTEKLDLLQEEPQIEEERLLTISEVEQMHQSFSDHIAQYWDIYQDNFAQLGETMMVTTNLFMPSTSLKTLMSEPLLTYSSVINLAQRQHVHQAETSFRTREFKWEWWGIDELICLAQSNESWTQTMAGLWGTSRRYTRGIFSKVSWSLLWR